MDVREYPEFAAGNIPGSRHVPLSKISALAGPSGLSEPILLICRSGKRATLARERLAGMGFTNLDILEGGIQAWQNAGLPLDVTSTAVWSLERQVRFIAGSLVLVFVVLGTAVSPWFLLGSGFVGAGLVFAGATDICMMATLLGKAFWNLPPATRHAVFGKGNRQL